MANTDFKSSLLKGDYQSGFIQSKNKKVAK